MRGLLSMCSIEHSWNISPGQAKALQIKLSPRVCIEPIKGKVRTIAGVDCAYSVNERSVIGAAVIGDYRPGHQTLIIACQCSKYRLRYLKLRDKKSAKQSILFIANPATSNYAHKVHIRLCSRPISKGGYSDPLTLYRNQESQPYPGSGYSGNPPRRSDF